jgi:dihydroneopterin aldolase
MTDKLTLDDVRFYGRHGVSAAERELGGWFAVDVELGLDLAAAALSDDLAATVDYRRLGRRIVDIGTGEPVNLLERLAGLVAEAVLREFPAREVTVRVRKLTPPLDGVAAIPGVEIRRVRS